MQGCCVSFWFIIDSLVWALPPRPGLKTQLWGVYEWWFCLNVSECSESTRTWLGNLANNKAFKVYHTKPPPRAGWLWQWHTFYLGGPVWTRTDLFGTESHLLGLCRNWSLLQPQSCCELAPCAAVYMAALGYRLQYCLRWIQVVHFLIVAMASQVCKSGAQLHDTTTVVWAIRMDSLPSPPRTCCS